MRENLMKKFCCLISSAVLAIGTVYADGSGVFAEHYNAGQNYMTQSQYSAAVVEFRKALKINYLDNSARIGLVNAYLARASYYAATEKNYEKAANDFRSALCYLKLYPTKEQAVQNSAGMIASATENLNRCLRVISFDTTPSSRYKKAEELRATSQFAAAAYEFSKAGESSQFVSDANNQIGDLMKILYNKNRSVDFYLEALKTNPTDGVLRMKCARTLDEIGRNDEALTQYNEALANAKGDTEILYSLERLYLKKLALTPNDAELNANIGAIKQAQGDFESALSYYGKAEKLNPSNVTTRLNVGTLFQQRKEYQKALQSYDSVLTLYPNNVQAMLYKAQAYTEMGDQKSAMVWYRKVLSADPANSIARAELNSAMKSSMSPAELIDYLSRNGSDSELYDYAYKLHKENKIDEAISGYRSVISKNPSMVDAYVNLAICYASKEDYNSAVNILNNAKSRFPSNALVAKTLQDVKKDSLSTRLAAASEYYDKKDYRSALNQYLAINPPTEASMLGAASSYQALGDYNNAIQFYTKAEKLNPANAEIPYYIGYLYSEQHKWAEAEIYLNKALKLNPQSQAKELLSYVNQNTSISILNEGIELFDKKNLQDALLKFNEVLKKEANNAYAYYYRGLVYDEQSQPKLAISDYMNVIKNSNEFPIANYMIAVDYDSLENYKEAYKYFQIFVSKYTTDDEYLQYAKKRMEELKPYAG